MTDLEQKARTLVDNFETSCTGMEPEAHPLKDELAKRIAVAMQALVAAAYAACAEHHPQDELDKACKCSCGVVCESWAQWEAHIRSLTPADAARELERRELEKVIEGLKTARARTLPGCRTLVNLGHVPEAVRAGEWVQMDIEGEIADVEQRLASLSKPAPVERKK